MITAAAMTMGTTGFLREVRSTRVASVGGCSRVSAKTRLSVRVIRGPHNHPGVKVL
jgi:hypothetical protein